MLKVNQMKGSQDKALGKVGQMKGSQDKALGKRRAGMMYCSQSEGLATCTSCTMNFWKMKDLQD